MKVKDLITKLLDCDMDSKVKIMFEAEVNGSIIAYMYDVKDAEPGGGAVLLKADDMWE